jgi:putative DNA primase/helicase
MQTNTIQELKQEIPPTLEMVPDLQKNGSAYNGPCPKCGGRDRFIVWPNGRFFCRQCEFKGDNLDLYCQQHGATVKELLDVDFQNIFDSQIKQNLPQKAIQVFEKRGLGAIVPYLLDNYMVGWYAKENAITFALFHARTNDIIGIQRIPIDGGKKKLWKRSNLTDGVLVIPGDANGPEIICEGVMDGLSARLVGEYTIVVLFSASTVKKLKYLSLKDPVLFLDHDPAGQKATKKAAGIIPNARAVDWSFAPENCKDINDLLRDGHQETTHRMIEEAQPCKNGEQTSIENSILDIRAFCKHRFPVRRDYLSPWLKESAIILLAGYRGIGKTFFALGAADAVSDGKSFGPWLCDHPVPVLFLDGEMPPQDIVERSQGLNLNSDREAPLYIYCDAFANQQGLPRAHLASEEWRDEMKRILLSKQVKLWFIDNLASLASGIDENAKQDWDPINQWFLDLRFAGITSVMLHHVNKDGGQRGTSAREDNLDVSVVLKPPHDYRPEDGARFIAHFSKARVRTSELSRITDTEFKLIADEDGRYVWTWSGVRQQMQNEVLTMLNDGVRQVDIADQLGISKGQVSKIRSKAIKCGYLTAKNNLTQDGFQAMKNGNC